jgi:hypothetical protein
MTPLALERFGAQQAIGRSLSGKASLSFPRAQDLKGAFYGKPAVWEAAANTTEWVLDTRPVATTNTRLVKPRMPVRPVSGATHGRRLLARTQFPSGRLISVLPVGVIARREPRDFIALSVLLPSITASNEIIADSVESIGR